jgi:hypothetical protein
VCHPSEVEYPDEVLARGRHAGFPWLVIHNGLGARCGYVRVPPGHPWHGQGRPPAEAHGGINFACPDVAGGRQDDQPGGWWVGFDTGHAWDLPDPELARRTEEGRWLLAAMADGAARWGELADEANRHGLDLPRMRVRTQPYVEDQCRSLCEQAARALVGG